LRPLAALILIVIAGSLSAQARPRTLDTVTVVASRTTSSDSLHATEVITRAEIARSAARTIADVLATRLGVDLSPRSPAQGDLSIRGSTADQVLILVDGQPVSDAQSGHYALDLATPLAAVERIEILRGMGSSLYGSPAIGGVVNIVTRAGAANMVSTHGGSYGTVGGAFATGTMRVGLTADFEKSDGHRNSTDYRDGAARLTAASSGPLGSMRTDLGFGVRDFGANAFYGPYNSIERTTSATVSSRWNGVMDNWAFSADAGTRRHGDHYVLIRGRPSVYENFHRSWQTNGGASARTNAGPIALALGADGQHNQLSSLRLGGRREWRAGSFVEASSRGSVLSFDAGARADHSSTFGDFVSPTAAVSARVNEHVQLRASGGGGFRDPTWTERYYVDPANQGDASLKPERFKTVDAGALLTNGASSFDLAAFVRDAANLIDWVKPAGSPTTTLWHATNVGKAEYRGLEATLTPPAIEGVSWSVFGSALRFTDNQGNGLAGKYALRPITRQIGARASRRIGESLDITIDALQAQRAREDGHLTGNARLAWHRRSLRVNLDATNLANAAWLDASGLPVAGRAFVLGAAWSPSAY
jgi:iron complex outermembrane receptor protein